MLPKNLGKLGERLALKYLQNKDYQLITQNFRCRLGEVDLILRDKKQIVFVEVKTRFSKKYGLPEEAVTASKQTSIIKTANYFLLLHPKLSDCFRIDVIAIELEPKTSKLTAVRHYKNITL